MTGNDLALGIQAGREVLRKLQEEAGWTTEEPVSDDVMNGYIELLESTVIGQHAAMQWVGKTMRREERT